MAILYIQDVSDLSANNIVVCDHCWDNRYSNMSPDFNELHANCDRPNLGHEPSIRRHLASGIWKMIGHSDNSVGWEITPLFGA